MNQKLTQRCREKVIDSDGVSDVGVFVSDTLSRLKVGGKIVVGFCPVPAYEFAMRVMKELENKNAFYEHTINGLDNTYTIRRLR